MKTLRELEKMYGGLHKGVSKSGKPHQGGDRCCVNEYDLVYEKYLPKSPKVVVEIGNFMGIGLQVFSDYFPDARIIGLDISPETVENPGRAEVHFFDQLSPNGIIEILKGEKADIVIDDGFHRAFSMVHTYKYFQPHLNKNSVYFIEDISKNEYMPKYIEDCVQYNPNPKHGRIAVVTNHDKPIKRAGISLIEKYNREFYR